MLVIFLSVSMSLHQTSCKEVTLVCNLKSSYVCSYFALSLEITFLFLLESQHPVLLISKIIAAKLFYCPENQIKLFYFAKLISLS